MEGKCKQGVDFKVMRVTNIEIDARSRSETLKELNTEWWKEYMEDNEKNQKFSKKIPKEGEASKRNMQQIKQWDW